MAGRLLHFDVIYAGRAVIKNIFAAADGKLVRVANSSSSSSQCSPYLAQSARCGEGEEGGGEAGCSSEDRNLNVTLMPRPAVHPPTASIRNPLCSSARLSPPLTPWHSLTESIPSRGRQAASQAVQHYTFALFFLKTASSSSFSWLLFNFSVGFSLVSVLRAQPAASCSCSLFSLFCLFSLLLLLKRF